MNQRTSVDEMDDIEDFKQLKSIYSSIAKEYPDITLDKQILAAANREIDQPNTRQIPKMGWWKRLSLPLSVMASFAMTVIAVNWFFPAPAKMLPGTSSPNHVNFEVLKSTKNLSKNDKRIPKALSQPVIILPPSTTDKTHFNSVQSADNSLKKNKMIDQVKQDKILTLSELLVQKNENTLNKNNQLIKTDSDQVAKLDYPDKEVWAREVISLFKQGKYSAAKKSLVRFKKVYPDYPIDEQLEIFYR